MGEIKMSSKNEGATILLTGLKSADNNTESDSVAVKLFVVLLKPVVSAAFLIFIGWIVLQFMGG
jgi:hypothetical protein